MPGLVPGIHAFGDTKDTQKDVEGPAMAIWPVLNSPAIST
jgi:hypothetical protein